MQNPTIFTNKSGNTVIYVMLGVVIALLLVILFLLVGNQPKVENPIPLLKTGTCNYNGRVYKAGDGFAADDGCNSCSCSENGQVACTLMACDAPVMEPGVQDGVQSSEPAQE